MIRAKDMAQQTKQHVENDHRTGVPYMREIINRGAADIHAHIVGIDGGEILLRAGQRVVQTQLRRISHCKYSPKRPVKSVRD